MHLACADRAEPVQTEVLARWNDCSVKWLLVDAILRGVEPGTSDWTLESSPGPSGVAAIDIVRHGDSIHVDTGALAAEVLAVPFWTVRSVMVEGVEVTEAPAIRAELALPRRGRDLRPALFEPHRLEVETAGPLRATLLAEGECLDTGGLRFRVRTCFFAGTGLARVRVTVHNPRRARHRGGLWDLGDPGSIVLNDLVLQTRLAGAALAAFVRPEADGPVAALDQAPWLLHQESSGGENWRSRNHIDRQGRVPCRFRGYRVRSPKGEHSGLRASPVIVVETESARLTAAVPEFWQQFPKSLELDGSCVSIGLFPGGGPDGIELQGGERKTHTVWLCFEPAGQESPDRTGTTPLDWVHLPARVACPPQWYAASGVAAPFLPAAEATDERLGTYLGAAAFGPGGVLARREVVDEYGWRHYGEVYADHENAHYPGPKPVISHYNNQFDVVLGAILQQMRSGDARWADLWEPLARHVIDIDIYHTDEDRSAYRGGLFWLTDHYRSAETATHRTYSGANRPKHGKPYGGGPGAEHNYATGLLHAYYLTGSRDALEAVLGLADWVIAMDDGAQTVFGLFDRCPTGLASATRSPDYHGPGRGAANSINTLLDGWQAAGDRKYLDKAEELIRRTIHPADDVAARDLLDVENRWSYTMHLAAVARYLDVKIELNELDFMYGYAQAALVRYAEWMVDNETPYFDNPEKLEYPTEAWAVQELRKANALRLAARHADEPLRARLLGRGGELADRAWDDLLRFESRGTARAVAVMLVEGLRDARFREAPEPPAPRLPGRHDFGLPEEFVPQRQRVLRSLTTFSGLARAAAVLVNPCNWPRMVRLAAAARN